MKLNKKRIFGIIFLIMVAIAAVLIFVKPMWSQDSYEAKVMEIVEQTDRDVRLIVERTTEVEADLLNSLSIGKDTKLIGINGEKVTIEDFQPNALVEVRVENSFIEEDPFYYPIVYEIKLVKSVK